MVKLPGQYKAKKCTDNVYLWHVLERKEKETQGTLYCANYEPRLDKTVLFLMKYLDIFCLNRIENTFGLVSN